ncbi:fibronectin type III domain-containing protein [Bacillus anthracis]|uniref:fibronectin type III domain-containing protein n=1 Tax=Bacillus anthracis TaxID=1392 RepID=UPI003D1BEDD1
MMIMCLSVLPSFTSAEVKDVVKGKVGYFKGTDAKTDFYKKTLEFMTDGDENTINAIHDPNDKKNTVYFDLDEVITVESFTGIFTKVLDRKYINVIYYDSDWNVLATYTGVDNAKEIIPNVKHVAISLNKISSYELVIKDFKVFGNDGKTDNVSDFKLVAGVNKVDLSWINPTDDSFSGVNIYKDGKFLAKVDKNLSSYVVDGLEDNKGYRFTVKSINSTGIETIGVSNFILTLPDPKKIPPGPVSSLVAEPTDKTVKLKWKSPKDDDLAGFKILQNGKQVAEIGLEEEFTVKNLKPLTDYTFGVMAVDKDKNDSTSVNLSVRTLEENDDEPPLVPSNVFAKPSNGALIATWDRVSDKDLAGYNVYLDDKKINSNLISSTNFTIKNLENNRKYKIQVQAVDRSGNASALSLAAYGTPDERTLPIIESKYSLQDVSDGVSVMFGQFWTVLAFAVGIPLAFYIIYKLKLTVLP